MGSRVIPMRVGTSDLLVETTPVAGSEQTSILDEAGHRVVDAYERAQDAIVEVACSMADTVSRMAERAVHPDRVEVEIGLKFTMQGNVLVAAASGEAALKVLVVYDANREREADPGTKR